MKRKISFFVSTLLLVVMLAGCFYSQESESSSTVSGSKRTQVVTKVKTASETPKHESTPVFVPDKETPKPSATEEALAGRCTCNFKYCWYDSDACEGPDPDYDFSDCPSENDYVYEEITCKQGSCADTDLCYNRYTDSYQECGTCHWGYGYDPSPTVELFYQGDCVWRGSNSNCSYRAVCVAKCPAEENENCP